MHGRSSGQRLRQHWQEALPVGRDRSQPVHQPTEDSLLVDENFVDPGYFETVGMRLMDGRDLDARDTERARGLL
jgi:hypothetical protein